MTFGIRYSSCGPQKPNDWHHGSTSGYGDDDPRQRALGGDPLRTLADVELITADYVAWYNRQRLMHRLGRVPPAEAESQYYSVHVTGQPGGSQNPEGA